MKLVNLAKTPSEVKAEKKEYEEPSESTDKYPWGLTLRLSEEVLEKLGVKDAADLPDVGTKIKIHALCKVKSVEQREEAEGKKKKSQEVSLQVCELALQDKGEASMDDKMARANKEVSDETGYS